MGRKVVKGWVREVIPHRSRPASSQKAQDNEPDLLLKRLGDLLSGATPIDEVIEALFWRTAKSNISSLTWMYMQICRLWYDNRDCHRANPFADLERSTSQPSLGI